jgi:hypothetical protein
MFASVFSFAQEDLLKDIDTIQTKNTEISQPAFKALQIVTGQSTKLPAKNEWYIVVAHRFGDVSKGFKDFSGWIMLLQNWVQSMVLQIKFH